MLRKSSWPFPIRNRDNPAYELTPLSQVANYGKAAMVARPKGPEPVRDEDYRRLVAALPCFECRIEGFSNAAHKNSGKAKGKKASDTEIFPLCVDRPGVLGCHGRFDRYELIDRAAMPAYEQRALAWTRAQFEGKI